MKAECKIFAVFMVAMVISVFSASRLYELSAHKQIESISRFGQLPSPAVQALSMEFKGVIADYLFLKTMTFLGEKIGKRQDPSEADWDLINQLLERITDLDSLFWDPYLFAETMLAWQAGMPEKANRLLLKASKYRNTDYRPLYFIGFNYFYFLQDPGRAAKYLRSAARLPNAPYYLKGLAARISLYGDQTDMAIAFLEDILKDTFDPSVRLYLEKRLVTLKIICFLEEKVKEYKSVYKTLPGSLQDLVKTGIISSIPDDPYGGRFVLLKNGKVYTTSQMVPKAEK
jgi:tetratricopeptide (TPR) repeat protein